MKLWMRPEVAWVSQFRESRYKSKGTIPGRLATSPSQRRIKHNKPAKTPVPKAFSIIQRLTSRIESS